MKLLAGMAINDAIIMYYEKHYALKQNDLTKLIELKKKCPEIFDKKNDAQIRSMIEYAKKFQTTELYKVLYQLRLKEKLVIVT